MAARQKPVIQRVPQPGSGSAGASATPEALRLGAAIS